MMKPAVDDTAMLRLVRKAVRIIGQDTPEARELLAAAAGEPLAALSEAIRRAPKIAQGYLDRADWYGGRGSWKKAAEDLGEASLLDPKTTTALHLGVVLVHLGEIDRYRELCRTSLARWGQTTVIGDAERTARLCLLRTDSGADAARIAQLVQVGVSGDEDRQTFEWYYLCEGLHAYRTGRFAEAVTTCRHSRRLHDQRQAIEGGLRASALAVEAMALHRQGNTAAARQSLREASRLIDDRLSIGDGDARWSTWLEAEEFCHEAEALIAGPKAATR
jgi:tetratricopeptide (TPR) repeat protein